MSEKKYDRSGAGNDSVGVGVGVDNETRFCTSGGVSALGIGNLSVLRALMQSCLASLLIQLQWRRLLYSQH